MPTICILHKLRDFKFQAASNCLFHLVQTWPCPLLSAKFDRAQRPKPPLMHPPKTYANITLPKVF